MTALSKKERTINAAMDNLTDNGMMWNDITPAVKNSLDTIYERLAGSNTYISGQMVADGYRASIAPRKKSSKRTF